MRLLLVSALLTLAACDSADAVAPLDVRLGELSTDPALLVGTWDLVSTTTAGWGGPAETATVPSGTETYTFRADGTVTVERNRQIAEEAVWVVEELELVGVKLRIGSETAYRRVFFGVTETRFYIDDRPLDGALYEYARR